jgi:PHD/YefM family antitoxin component YafN of YafNO toxin-antitoxin module
MEQITNQEIIEKLKHIEQSMVTKKELESVMETIAISSNQDTMNQIRESEKDIEEGRTHEINSVSDI